MAIDADGIGITERITTAFTEPGSHQQLVVEQRTQSLQGAAHRRHVPLN